MKWCLLLLLLCVAGGVPGILAGPSACGLGRTGPGSLRPGGGCFSLLVVESVMSLVQFPGGSWILTIHVYVWTCLSQDRNEFDIRQFTKRFLKAGTCGGRISSRVPKGELGV